MSDSESPTKPSTRPNSTLDSYVSSSKPQTAPQPLATSAEIRDRGSAFIANIFTATSPEEAKSHMQYVKHILHAHKKASHEIAAWRCMIVKPGCTGLGGPEEFELAQGHLDDGERWAGDRALKVMRDLAVIDAVIVVSRWYGGTLLGPSRFDHIETCAAEVCRAFKRTEELRESVTTLKTLDTLLESLREELRVLQSAASGAKIGDLATPSSQRKLHHMRDDREETSKKDYTLIDLTKVRRLIKARENAIKWVKNSLDDMRNSENHRQK
ncbi:hypothetical protein AGABI1DRAFT_71918 [Agaricus bisporus var. burnettii JB137-S8]|uniref:Impact N-terminal domain-containing protein n=1 Tax=Agaricus bisporus var. burnettii (strain JB137-S8 / ATCC MYA-4627 / FGSC 10392) TaxID=597362 RepID=K5Y075_AGABU|nr:uncharacterized protein AGABI1DRAFT_71918 [Agaricus bisporus var. burnettii JB137-S8]EKM81115.1 hypothetical protein AGABI1DRAFT_71918 [Agaricus bisporus var. burnettii JB137-S8]